MSTAILNLSDTSQRMLQELVEHTGQSANEVVDKALDAYRRKLFFEAMDAGYIALRADPVAWAAHLAERQQWDATLLDGLDAQEQWSEDGHCLTPKPQG